MKDLHGKTRIDDWGKWFLATETNDETLDEKIEKLLAASLAVLARSSHLAN